MIILDLVNQGVDCNKGHLLNGLTPMIIAVKNGLHELCELYCKKGIDLNKVFIFKWFLCFYLFVVSA